MKRKIIPYIYIVILLWNLEGIYGQKFHLKISTKDSINTILVKAIPYQKKHLSKASLLSSLDSIKHQLELKGFLNSSFDTVIINDTIYHANFVLGHLSETIRIYYANKDILKKDFFYIVPSINNNFFDISMKNLPSTLQAIVNFFESKGNSFVEVSLKNIQQNGNLIEAYLAIKKSNYRKIDKVIVNGYENFPKTYLKHYLSLRNATLFNHKKLNNASKLIQMLSFVTETKPPEVLFTKDSTIVYLYLKKKVSNTFDGLIGFSSKENGGGISFNGYLDLSLHNILDGGETFSLHWKNNSKERQVFNLGVTIPYIFNSRLSPKIALNIYKQDSSFINTKTTFLVPYSIDKQNTLGLSLYTETSTNLLTNTINSTDINDFKTTFYGVNYSYSVYNNSLFPIKFLIHTEILTGKRKTNELTNNQSKLSLNTIYLWNLNRKNHLFFQNRTSTLLSNNLNINELFRIGGVNSIRGFDEESIFASTYSYFTIEYRFNTNNQSYLYSITDVGYVDNEITNQSSQIYSLGIGYGFKTKIGLLNLSYAIGNSSNLPFDINNSRFHIKILSSF